MCDSVPSRLAHLLRIENKYQPLASVQVNNDNPSATTRAHQLIVLLLQVAAESMQLTNTSFKDNSLAESLREDKWKPQSNDEEWKMVRRKDCKMILKEIEENQF
ncbi:hypothetical protein EVAR_97531_1 [Eumeta japonica]|uniref:Uncharacterized protein n=1 Tax=Eumeta variegata TaxID=151549 RepID=A0A4C1WLB7_EUMVA|nr:hypothetical protein EVAR_97531_1 [Eumeta japonica]